jgi:RNA polymerase sigma-70 factor (ECF subfamily)
MSAEFQHLVDQYYEALYRFGLSLCQSEAEACDLTQQTFYRWAEKGHQLRDRSKAKTWLFTTLHREFLGGRRHTTRFPKIELGEVEHELPSTPVPAYDALDSSTVLEALGQLEEKFRAPLTLFYLEEHSYQEIAEILDLPIGTVMSRLSRAKEALRHAVTTGGVQRAEKIIPFPPKAQHG